MSLQLFVYPFMQAFTRFSSVYYAAFYRESYKAPSCFRGSTASLGSAKLVIEAFCRLLKTARMPWCCRQRRRGSDNPWMYVMRYFDRSHMHLTIPRLTG